MNSFSSEISQRYALALYDLSKENNQTEEFVTNIKEFMKAFNSNESLRFFVKNPHLKILGKTDPKWPKWTFLDF